MFDRSVWRVAALAGAAAQTRELLEQQVPGEVLASLVAGLDPGELDGYDLVSYLGACERQTAWAQARQLAAVRELAERATADPARPGALRVGSREFVADEVAAQLSVSRTAGEMRVWLAVGLGRLPGTEAALRAGRLDLTRARAIVEELSALDDDAVAAAVETRILARAPEQTLANLRRSLTRAVLAADPGAADRRGARAHAQRRVVLTPQPDGMCEFWALLPAPDAIALWSAITALADHAGQADRAADHPDTRDATHPDTDPDTDRDEAAGGRRTLDQRRADVLADLAYAVLDRADLPRSHRRRPHLHVTVAATTLLGLDDQPGELAGYGPITAQAGRAVAGDATWRRLLTDPATGALLDYGNTVHDPPQALADHVITRDQTCRGIGCRVPAARCDLDHTITFPTGPTAAHNLTCQCRHCHRKRHQAGWTLALDPHGNLTWTTPTGHTYHDPVPAVLELCPPRPPPDEDLPPDDPPPF